MKKMPSTYAHYRFGQEVLKELPNDIKKIIIENKELYDIGLHGPDLLFYYLPLKTRSEERRVGKECRSRWSPYH